MNVQRKVRNLCKIQNSFSCCENVLSPENVQYLWLLATLIYCDSQKRSHTLTLTQNHSRAPLRVCGQPRALTQGPSHQTLPSYVLIYHCSAIGSPCCFNLNYYCKTFIVKIIVRHFRLGSPRKQRRACRLGRALRNTTCEGVKEARLGTGRS